jgi:biotin operon repressor
MTEFEKTLSEYRNLVEQVADERGFLSFLEDQLAGVEKKLKAIVTTSQATPYQVCLSSFHLPVPAKRAEPDVPALQEAARAVEELGSGVSAEQLAKHLNITRDAARLRLQRAARTGLIARMAAGRYRAIKQAPQMTTEDKQTDGAGGLAPEPSNGLVAKVD